MRLSGFRDWSLGTGMLGSWDGYCKFGIKSAVIIINTIQMSTDSNKNKRVFISSSYRDRDQDRSTCRKKVLESLKKYFDLHGGNLTGVAPGEEQRDDC